jgi:predicted ArsR family transcriptional regulator
MTIDELAESLGLTRTAVRSHLTTLQHEGAVEERGARRGTSKPARTYGVTSEAELTFSRAYVPILTQLLHVLAGHMSGEEFDAVMREVGRRMMDGRLAPKGSVRERVLAGSNLLNDLGGLTEVVDEADVFVIQSHGCPLAAATAEHPEACNALESMLSEFVGQQVAKCCDRYDRARCCFEVGRESQPGRMEARR